MIVSGEKLYCYFTAQFCLCKIFLKKEKGHLRRDGPAKAVYKAVAVAEMVEALLRLGNHKFEPAAAVEALDFPCLAVSVHFVAGTTPPSLNADFVHLFEHHFGGGLVLAPVLLSDPGRLVPDLVHLIDAPLFRGSGSPAYCGAGLGECQTAERLDFRMGHCPPPVLE
ncbi:MAG: hypothetical protein KGJ93_02530 [Patescibacteria group bacterium]|nr:hypothetical protein [Patescibacteria group bacterium]